MCVCADDPGLPPQEGAGLHRGHAHLPPLEAGGQEVRSVLPESGRRPGVRQGGEEGHGGPGRR